jgi:biopolymer transport protein ExbD
MKIRKMGGGLAEKIDINMTPMIDIVFQLMAFFIMTLKIVSLEGDFNIKMPLAAQGAPSDALIPPIQVRLTAGVDGSLAGIKVGENNLGSFDALRSEVMDLVGGTGPDSLAKEAEVEIDADYNLRYEYVIEAITAVTGYVSPDRKIVPLIEKIKFAQPREAG